VSCLHGQYDAECEATHAEAGSETHLRCYQATSQKTVHPKTNAKQGQEGCHIPTQRETRVVGEYRPGTLGHAGYEAMSMRSIVREAQKRLP